MFKVQIDREKCQGCGECVDNCPAELLAMDGDKAFVVGDPNECLGCQTCVSFCLNEAVMVSDV